MSDSLPFSTMPAPEGTGAASASDNIGDAPARAATADRRTPLHALHVARGAKMVSFAGYDMPLQYGGGILAETQHTRRAASLFDVSHMGQLDVLGADADLALERLLPADLVGLAARQQRYSVLTNTAGGVLDDLMVARGPQGLALIVNAARKDTDFTHLQRGLVGDAQVIMREDLALLALQGPQARVVLCRLNPRIADLFFLQQDIFTLAGLPCRVSCSGYTGEDGFEISVRGSDVQALAEALLAHPEVALAGLGARDALRLEAGLCLYGHDLTEHTTPVEAGVVFAIARSRRARGERPGGFPGAERILAEIAGGPARLRVGLLPEERAPLREGVRLFDETGRPVGDICSGSFSPSLNRPIAMAYVQREWSITGTQLFAEQRGRQVPARVCSLPFVPARVARS